MVFHIFSAFTPFIGQKGPLSVISPIRGVILKVRSKAGSLFEGRTRMGAMMWAKFGGSPLQLGLTVCNSFRASGSGGRWLVPLVNSALNAEPSPYFWLIHSKPFIDYLLCAQALIVVNNRRLQLLKNTTHSCGRDRDTDKESYSNMILTKK